MDFLRLHKNTVIIGSLILLLIISLLYTTRPEKISAYAVEKQDFVPSLLLSGEVITEGSTLISALTSGTVIDCPVAKGDKVKKGQLLIQIDDSQAIIDRNRAAALLETSCLQLQIAKTVTREEARVNSTQNDLELEKAEQQYTRFNSLFEAGAISQAEWEEAGRNLKLAEEQARLARLTMEALEDNGSTIAILQSEVQQRHLDLAEKELLVEKYKTVSPADGELLDIYVRPGEFLSTTSKAALLKDGKDLRIKIQPDQRYAALAALGNHAQVWLTDSSANKWDTLIVYTEPTGNAEQGSLTVELAFTSNQPQLYPGQLVSVQLFGPQQKEAIILPDRYLTEQDGEGGVWLAIDNRAHFVPLQIGLRTENGVVITQGLREGDMVLEATGLEEDQKVLPQPVEV
ncbi:MAG: biotin/lipoyl-binding protein [Syntrophomonadaceae bacterium]|jgi:HlyD family secretion protein|nr:biotin/lipoyl-binding protein [Syntrophomonadaceae bacterium]